MKRLNVNISDKAHNKIVNLKLTLKLNKLDDVIEYLTTLTNLKGGKPK